MKIIVEKYYLMRSNIQLKIIIESMFRILGHILVEKSNSFHRFTQDALHTCPLLVICFHAHMILVFRTLLPLSKSLFLFLSSPSILFDCYMHRLNWCWICSMRALFVRCLCSNTNDLVLLIHFIRWRQVKQRASFLAYL